MKAVNIGIVESAREDIADGLNRLLADSYTLLLKTHNYHWNVTGPLFGSLHTLFEQQYVELFDAVDLVAERVRALGFKVPASFKHFSEVAVVKEASGYPRAMDMVKDLMGDHEKIASVIGKVFPIAQEAGDEATLDLLNQRLTAHQKTAWMLRSTSEE